MWQAPAEHNKQPAGRGHLHPPPCARPALCHVQLRQRARNRGGAAHLPSGQGPSFCGHSYYHYTLFLPEARCVCRQAAVKAAKSYPLMDSPDPSKTQSTVGIIVPLEYHIRPVVVLTAFLQHLLGLEAPETDVGSASLKQAQLCSFFQVPIAAKVSLAQNEYQLHLWQP